ncbi:MAG: C1 family peptidase [Betaproteobacteria bacterium]|nr:C1 family peptidase [Betaproteobacteria bacterium]
MPKRSLVVSGKAVTLDARPDRLDLRDREYVPPLESLPPRYPEAQKLSKYLSTYVSSGLILDQGSEGACTGYGLAAVVNYLLWVRALEANTVKAFHGVSLHMLYDLARFYDEWPGEDYEGSSCRGAMKGWHKHGVCEKSLWKQSVKPGRAAAVKGKKAQKSKQAQRPYKPDGGWAQDAATRPVGVYYRVNHRSVVDMQAAIKNMGAIYVAADVHDHWDLNTTRKPKTAIGHDTLPVIEYKPGTKISGGHAFALVGYNERGFVVQNSWGGKWGVGSFAVLTYADWVANGADAWVCALGVPQTLASLNNLALAGATARQHKTSLLAGESLPDGVGAVTPLVSPWSTARAYEHTVVAGNNGQVRICLPDVGTPEGAVERVVKDNIGAWLKNTDKKARKVMIYAHGGLNKEEDSIARIRTLGPYFLENGVYPLFYT